MSYFNNFPTTQKTPGIPNLQMNAPIAPKHVEGCVGLELEIEGRDLPQPGEFPRTMSCPTTGARWSGHADGSLRGENLEYVLDRPASIEGAADLVERLFLFFREKGTKLTLSNRCSTHVHLNVSNWKVNQISAFLALWSAVEPALIEWCGIERKSNHFCLGIEDTTAVLDSWATFLETGRIDFPNGQKYTALNPLHLFDFGSLEVRCGRAPDNARDVINWTKLLWALRELVAEEFNNPASVAELVSMERASGILRRACDKAGIPEFFDELSRACPDMDSRGHATFREAQRICCAFPWADWIVLCEKKYIPNPFAPASKRQIARDPGLEINRLRDLDERIIRPAPRPNDNF